MADEILLARSAFTGVTPPSLAPTNAPGVTVEERDGFSLISVTARKGRASALADGVRGAYGIALPATPRRVEAGGIAVLWAGPDQWFFMADKAPKDWEMALRGQLGAFASITDQSDGRALLRVSGPGARAALAKGLPIDLHPRSFKPGDVAITIAAHIGVQVWQLDEGPTYELALFRGFAESFFAWLADSCLEYGLRFVRRST